MKQRQNQNRIESYVQSCFSKRAKRRYTAVTLIETLLYLALTSVMLVVITGSFNSFLKTRSRALVRGEVDTQAAYIIDRLEYVLRNAESVSIPANLGSGTSLTFVENGQVGNSIIALITDKITIYRPIGGTEVFSNNRVSITSLKIDNHAPIGDPPLITINFKIDYKGGEGPEFDYSKVYQTTILVRDY